MVKLFHLGDVQLGGPLYVATDALLERMRAGQRTALRRAVDFALREEVDALLVAGPLVDERFVDIGTEQFVAKQFTRLEEAGIRSFCIADSADSGSPAARESSVRWPPALHRFIDSAPEAVTLKGDGGEPVIRIVGSGRSTPAEEEPADAVFPPAEEAVPHVGLLHVSSAEARSADLRHAFERAGYAYWALGGAPRRRAADAEAPAWYAGVLAGRTPTEAGPQGGLLVSLKAGQEPRVSFQSFAPLCWADLYLDDLAAVDTQHALLQRAGRTFKERADDEHQAAWLARFTLAGGCPLAPSLHEGQARRDLEAALAEHLDLEAAFVRLRHLTPPVDPVRHRDEPHVLSEALALLDRAQANPSLLRELAPDVLAAAPEDSTTEGYLSELAEALDREACARLLRKAPPE